MRVASGVSPYPGISINTGISSGFLGVSAGAGVSGSNPNSGGGGTGNHILTESGNFLTTESGLRLITEQVLTRGLQFNQALSSQYLTLAGVGGM